MVDGVHHRIALERNGHDFAAELPVRHAIQDQTPVIADAKKQQFAILGRTHHHVTRITGVCAKDSEAVKPRVVQTLALRLRSQHRYQKNHKSAEKKIENKPALPCFHPASPFVPSGESRAYTLVLTNASF